MFKGIASGLDPGRDPELAIDGLYVDIDGMRTQGKSLGDLVVGQSLSNQV